MKTLFAILIFFSVWSSSYAWMGVAGEPTYPYSPYSPVLTLPTFNFIVDGPSEAEMALTAKIDNQEVRMKLLFDALDSAKIILNKQESEIKKLERINAQNKVKIRKQKQRRDKESRISMWIISLLGISTAIGAVLAIRLVLK